MKARLVRIGNSRGVRLPKPLIEEAGLTDEVEVRVREGAVIIVPAARPRSGWAEAGGDREDRGAARAATEGSGRGRTEMADFALKARGQ